jgi:drug/metabolite transporter (DMT)-like permease
MNRTAVTYALASAVLFGISTPAAKVLLGSVHPVVLAGLFYCGAGCGVALLRRLAATGLTNAQRAEVTLGRRDIPWLAGAIVCGGIVGPLLLMVGLAQTDAAAASLLLTLEGAATALIAWVVFRENVGIRVGIGMACLVAGVVTLSWSGIPTMERIAGPFAIVGACVAWGLDNNLTRKVSLSDPLQIVQIKGLVAGPVNLALGLWAGSPPPATSTLLIAMSVGFVGYGISLVLFVLALRHLGSARTSAYFSTAPFFGAFAAVIFLGEPVTVGLLVAGGFMGLGVWLHLTEQHEHVHLHDAVVHAHPHVHDEHHRHEHSAFDPAGEPHTHVHRHPRLTHAHQHVPDMHHLHRHP